MFLHKAGMFEFANICELENVSGLSVRAASAKILRRLAKWHRKRILNS